METDDNLALDCRIAEMLGWTECRVLTHSPADTFSVGVNPKRPDMGSHSPIPSYSTDIREVIAVCRERGWCCGRDAVYEDEKFIGWAWSVSKPKGPYSIIMEGNNYPRAAAEALAGMLEQEKK